MSLILLTFHMSANRNFRKKTYMKNRTNGRRDGTTITSELDFLLLFPALVMVIFIIYPLKKYKQYAACGGIA